jgi:hypothetical protein
MGIYLWNGVVYVCLPVFLNLLRTIETEYCQCMYNGTAVGTTRPRMEGRGVPNMGSIIRTTPYRMSHIPTKFFLINEIVILYSEVLRST